MSFDPPLCFDVGRLSSSHTNQTQAPCSWTSWLHKWKPNQLLFQKMHSLISKIWNQAKVPHGKNTTQNGEARDSGAVLGTKDVCKLRQTIVSISITVWVLVYRKKTLICFDFPDYINYRSFSDSEEDLGRFGGKPKVLRQENTNFFFINSYTLWLE